MVDLSDEPVLGPRERLLWASRALALGLPYVGADFRFDPPPLVPVETPSLAVIGLGKRVGKTAVTGHVARVLARDRRVVVVAMGRGGPAEPELVETPPTLDDLLALSRSGRHAASDHLETAALAGVPTIGCRRAGGGLAGAPFVSNVAEGVRARRAARPGAGRLRRQRRRAPAGRGRRADPRHERPARSTRRPQRVSRARLRPRRRHGRRRPGGDPLDLGRAGRRRRAAAAPGRAARAAAAPRCSRPGQRRPTSSTPTSSTSRAISHAATRCATSSSTSTRRSTSSSSRRPRSTSSPRPRSRAARRSCSPRTTSSRTSSTSGCSRLARQAVRA